MKIGKLILKYERKIQELKKEVEELQDHESYLEVRLAETEKEYATFVQTAWDKIAELKKQLNEEQP